MTLATEQMLSERLRYRWHAGYDPHNEYDCNPEWATDTLTEVADDSVTFRDQWDPEHMWMRSDLVYDLTQTL